MIVYTYKKTTVVYLFILYEDFYSGLISLELIDANEIQRMVSCDVRSTDNKSYMWRIGEMEKHLVVYWDSWGTCSQN